jgi:hypothetical protein
MQPTLSSDCRAAAQFNPGLEVLRRDSRESPVRPAGGSGAGWEEPGARGSTVWGAKLGSDGSPRRGRRVKGQSRGTDGRGILQASPVTLPSARAMNRVLLSKGLEINDLCSSDSRAGPRQAKPPTSHPQAICLGVASHPHATLMRPSSHHKAICKPCDWEGIGRGKPGTCVGQARDRPLGAWGVERSVQPVVSTWAA